MAALSQSTRRKLSLLPLAQELGNVSKACRLMGYHARHLLRGLPAPSRSAGCRRSSSSVAARGGRIRTASARDRETGSSPWLMRWKRLLGDRSRLGSDRGRRPISGDTRIWVAPSNAILSQLCDGEVEGIGVRRPLPPLAPGS